MCGDAKPPRGEGGPPKAMCHHPKCKKGWEIVMPPQIIMWCPCGKQTPTSPSNPHMTSTSKGSSI